MVKNLGIKTLEISGGNNVGGIVGFNKGTITNCYIKDGTVKATSSGYAGGIAGYNDCLKKWLLRQMIRLRPIRKAE